MAVALKTSFTNNHLEVKEKCLITYYIHLYKYEEKFSTVDYKILLHFPPQYQFYLFSWLCHIWWQINHYSDTCTHKSCWYCSIKFKRAMNKIYEWSQLWKLEFMLDLQIHESPDSILARPLSKNIPSTIYPLQINIHT